MTTTVQRPTFVRVPVVVTAALLRGLDLWERGFGGAEFRPVAREAAAMIRTDRASLAQLRRWAAWHATHGARPVEVVMRTVTGSPANLGWLLHGGDAGARWVRRMAP